MKLEEFNKLEGIVKKQDFYISYKGINSLLFYLSLFGNVASVFCGFFFLSKLITDSVTVLTNTYIIYAISLLLLTGLELLKRDIFDKFSLEFIRFKTLAKKEVATLALFCLFVISFSFYASLTGAKEFSSKNDVLETEQKLTVNGYVDSLNKLANTKINVINGDISKIKEKDDLKDKEQTTLEGLEKLTTQQKNRVKDLKAERIIYKDDITKLKNEIDSITVQTKRNVDSYAAEVAQSTDKEKDKNSSNSKVFVIISTIIELLILIGIYFNKTYKFKSYDEYKAKFNNDPIFQKWKTNNSIIEILYINEPKLGDKVLSINSMKDLCKINNISVNERELADSMKLFTALKIVKVSGNARYLEKDKETAIEILKKHFKVE